MAGVPAWSRACPPRVAASAGLPAGFLEGLPASFLAGIRDMGAVLSSLESTLTRSGGKHFISLDFNPLRKNAYAILDRNAFRMNIY